MKRFLLVLTTCLALTSCTLEQAQTSSRTAEHIKSETSSLKYLIADRTSIVMDNCMKGQEFLNATEEERSSSKYAFFGWYSTTKSIKIDNWGEIFPNDSDLLTVGSSWMVKLNNYTYCVYCIEENKWSISYPLNESDDSDYVEKGLSFTTLYSLSGKDRDGYNRWECHVDGCYQVSETIYETISTGSDKLDYFWVPVVNQSGYFSMSLRSSGKITSRFFIKGEPADWCTLTYEKGEITNCTSNLK